MKFIVAAFWKLAMTEDIVVATYPSAEGRRGAHGCIFQGRKTRGVATNVYLRKTSKKPERCGLRTLSVKGSGVVFTHGEGISTPRVRHKGRKPFNQMCNIMSLICFIFPFFYFIIFMKQLVGVLFWTLYCCVWLNCKGACHLSFFFYYYLIFHQMLNGCWKVQWMEPEGYKDFISWVKQRRA